MTQLNPTNPASMPMRLQPDGVVHRISPRPPGLTSTPDALALLKALRRRWVLALGMGLLLAGIAGGVVWYLVPQAKYTASATLQVFTNPKRIMFDPRENAADYHTYQRTQVALVKNRKILAHALRKPEVAELETIRKQGDAEEWLATQLRADFPGGSEILEISLSDDRPDDVAKVVNAVVKSYMTLIVEAERKEKLDRLDNLKKLLEKYQAELKIKRKNLRELAESIGASDEKALGLSQQFKAEHLAVAQREKLQAQTEMMKARAQLAVVEAERHEEGPDLAALEAAIDEQVEQSPQVVRQRALMNDLGRKYQDARRIAKKDSDPSVMAAQKHWRAVVKELDGLRAKLRPAIAERLGNGPPDARQAALAKVRGQIELWKAYHDALGKDIERLQGESKSIAVGGQDMENERDHLGISSEVARKVGAEVEAVEVELGAPERTRVLADAKSPVRRDEFRKVKAGGLAALGAFVSVLLGVSFWEFQARRVGAADEVVNSLGMKLVGALPALPARQGAARDPRWQSMMIESVDAMRAVLLHAAHADSLRVVMVTSAVKGEGKTSLACHLATSIARAGRRTLLVDCDLRCPASHRLFDLAAGPGLCDLLRGEADVADLVQETPADGLSLIPAGRCDPLALQALARDGLRALFDDLRGRYDFIIVDSAPVLPVSDSLLIGQSVDAVLFSVLREVSRLPMVYAAYERLAELGVKMLGAVVTGVQAEAYDSYYRLSP